MKKFPVFHVVLALFRVFPWRSPAQEFRASVLVQVLDSTGSAIPGATLSLTRSDSGTNLGQSTDARGEARFVGLIPSRYRLNVAAAGFAARSQDLVIAVGSQLAIRVTLAPESLRQSAEAPPSLRCFS